jgi:predicted membrane-bound mannosyltransferase
VWTEALILVLAVAGCVAALAARDKDRAVAGRFLVVYTLAMVVVYSVIPYKTPWSMMGFLHGLILLAGLGAAALVRRVAKGVPRMAVIALLAAGVGHLAVQSVRANFRYHSDGRNPYAYAQTSTDLMRLVKRMEDLCAIHPDGPAMFVQVFGPEYWPLPWYLRFQSRIGYWPEVTVPPRAPVVMAGPGQAEAVEAQLGDRYQAEFYGLREGVILRVYIEKGLWSEFLGGGDE